MIDQGIRRPASAIVREFLAILGAANCGRVGADQLDPKALEGAIAVKCHRQIERRLPSARSAEMRPVAPFR